MGRACSTYGREMRCLKVLVGEFERKRLLGIHRRRWEDNIKRIIQK
jgi:hypothetical protein